MIILPIGPESEPERTAAPTSRPAPLQSTLRVLVYGFTPSERELIQGIVSLSQRRPLRLELTRSDDADTADVILLDGADAKVMAWAAKASMLVGKTVIQVDGQSAPHGATHLQRPIQWPKLPSLLLHAMDPNSPLLSTRQSLISTF